MSLSTKSAELSVAHRRCYPCDMGKPIESRVQQAVDELKEAIASFSAFYELPDTREHPPAAPREEIDALAKAIGRPLPPSFEAFLAIQDGFQEVDGHADILSASDIARRNQSGPDDVRADVARRVTGVQAENIVVIGCA
ncbi:MAG TPA: SMI1/KNR4 family protein, partial [Kofleriaceae bacterium]|nr:SMI1/KNR4 family protein [Kofleriaceae bacterium]